MQRTFEGSASGIASSLKELKPVVTLEGKDTEFGEVGEVTVDMVANWLMGKGLREVAARRVGEEGEELRPESGGSSPFQGMQRCAKESK